MSKDKPIWHGRFEKAPDDSTLQFVQSISFDYRLYKYDIVGSIAHAGMLYEIGVLTKEEFEKITEALKEIAEEIEEGKFPLDVKYEDIHMAIETRLIEKIGETGKKLHTARSRNDQIALDLRLYLRDIIDLHLLPAINKLQTAFVELADKYKDIVAPGFTHLQHAQPVMLSSILLSYVEQLERDLARLEDARKRLNVLPLGSAAIAGTTINLKRSSVAKKLGFKEISRNSIDAVSDRDFAIEILSDIAMIGMHLSRWAEDWIIWSSEEFNFVRLGEEFCTGSSIMPQKRNPDTLELIRAKAGRLYGQLVSLLTILKALPCGYNRDLQEDKPAIFDAVDTILASLKIAAKIVENAEFNQEAIEEKLEKGFLEATALAEYLVEKKVPFREAHKIVGTIVSYCEKKGIESLKKLNIDELRKFTPHIDKDVYEVLDPKTLVNRYKSYGSAGRRFTLKQIKRWKSLLSYRSQDSPD